VILTSAPPYGGSATDPAQRQSPPDPARQADGG